MQKGMVSIVMLTCLATSLEASKTRGVAQWSVLTYIAGDNNLDQFAYYNIDAMQKGVKATDQVNALVQWDKPGDNKTWRYKIVPGGKIEDESVSSSEMGYDPSVEVFGGMQWVVNNYPALHNALILWNHGSGIQDFSPGEFQRKRNRSSWIEMIGNGKESLEKRGVLYDDSQGTCLTNQGLVDALSGIKGLLGRNLDFLGMDACLMGMLEVDYEVSDYVDYIVASQESIPGEGWEYKGLLSALTSMPTMSPADFAKAAISSYGRFYRRQGTSPTFTLAAHDLSLVKNVVNSLETVINFLNQIKQSSPKTVVKAVQAARAASLQMDDFPEYIDLGSFVSELKKRFADKKKKHAQSTQKLVEFNRVARSTRSVLQGCLDSISQLVISKVSGIRRTGACGVSIYFPRQGGIHSSYLDTVFAKNTSWLNFIRDYSS